MEDIDFLVDFVAGNSIFFFFFFCKELGLKGKNQLIPQMGLFHIVEFRKCEKIKECVHTWANGTGYHEC